MIVLGYIVLNHFSQRDMKNNRFPQKYAENNRFPQKITVSPKMI